METILKQTREVGTSAGVLLPRKWLNKQVVVTLFNPTNEDIAKDILEILFRHNLNEEAKGIYLYGSYAREDYDSDSDIDVLVITEKTNKLISQDNYEIMLISEDNLTKNLHDNLHYLSIIKEAKAIINKSLIEKKFINKDKININKILTEIKRIIKVNKEAIKNCKDKGINVPDGIVYSIVLRLRELYLIKCIILNKKYYKKDLIKISGGEAYSAYIRIKRDEKEIDNLSPDKVNNLLELSEKWVKDLKE